MTSEQQTIQNSGHVLMIKQVNFSDPLCPMNKMQQNDIFCFFVDLQNEVLACGNAAKSFREQIYQSPLKFEDVKENDIETSKIHY